MIDHKKSYQWIPILIVRLLLGLFFMVVGIQKLFIPYYHSLFLNLLNELHLPAVSLLVYLIPCLECLCGLSLFLGYFTNVGAFFLLCITLATFIFTKLQAISPVAFFMSFVYLPETLLSLLFLWLTFSGGAEKSLDAYLKKKKHI